MENNLDSIVCQLKKYFIKLRENRTRYILPCEDYQTVYSKVRCEKIDEQVSKKAVMVSEIMSHDEHKIESLNAFADEIKNCSRCNELATTRKQVVFGDGHPNAQLMFVGEAPGADEDTQGKPFVGRAGKLLTKIIQAIGLERKDVFIANVLKCRPPRNRNPKPDEIANCNEYLLRQIEIIKPRVICTLGSFAAQTLLNTKQSISSLRGQEQKFGDCILVPTFHPSYLLRSPYKKKEVWKDMLMVKKILSR